ncbi:hypothetical protein [Legionella sp. CNM-4043-24]|uniref:hypothetical protein n=1 Tax=Legionella sp. CNM-4043-24 TaxID=3421646 RepID=UPI00403B083F
MSQHKFWGSYHRSEATRFFAHAGRRKNAQIISPCLKKTGQANSFSAHTGGIHSPFHFDSYRNLITLKHEVPRSDEPVRDTLLDYKNRLAMAIVKGFETHNKPSTGVKPKRPIVYTENGYPCVMVQLPILKRECSKTPVARYWQKKPQQFQCLLMASFIAIVNVEAMSAGIPIEMVLRAGFGHNTPSVCQTNKTFRINTGLIPLAYAELAGKSLAKLNELIEAMNQSSYTRPATFSVEQLDQVRRYNAQKLMSAIERNACYKKIREEEPLMSEMAELPEVFNRVYEKFKTITQSKPQGYSTFIPVSLEHATVWEIFARPGDSMGKSILKECFRMPGTEEWFANQVMNALLNGASNPIESAMVELLTCLRYGETATMDYSRIRAGLNQRFTFPREDFTAVYEQDKAFDEIIQLLSGALLIPKPTLNLYATLERAAVSLFTQYKSQEMVSSTDDYGSDSDFSDDDMAHDEVKETDESEKKHLSHTKYRVCSGMKAIVIAQYAALCYLASKENKTYRIDFKQMYYEVAEAFQYVKAKDMQLNKIRSNSGASILHYDLNHCNSTNKAFPSLSEKLSRTQYTVVILDYTSSTSKQIKQALRTCFSHAGIEAVMLVESGLKNSQGGADFNPYGEVRICCSSRERTTQMAHYVREGLSEADKLTPQAHELVRICKLRKMAFSLKSLFFKPAPPEHREAEAMALSIKHPV